MIAALDRVGVELADGTFAFGPGDEDIHTAIERRVTELAGPAGAKLHTGRSRNDQVADRVAAVPQARGHRRGAPDARAPGGLARAREGRGLRRLSPGLHAPPARATGPARASLPRTLLGVRGVTSTAGTTRSARADVSPLGAGALAGSSLPLDPDSVAAELGFAHRFDNSLDAVSDRDFVAEALFVLALDRRCTSPAWVRRSCCGRARSSGSCASPTRTAPVRRCCPRRRTPTSPSSLAARRAG